MPTPARTSVDAIVNAGRAILDADGLDAVSMQRVATTVGVRAPSLYKRVRDRDALVRLIAADVLAELGACVEAASTGEDPPTDLAAIAHAFRGWALQHPGAFGLVFSRLPDAWQPAPDADPMTGTFGALFRAVAALSRPDDVLEASRLVVAWASGFVGMELAGAFRMGGDVDAAFAYGIDRLVRAIAR
jgi:AcrR family transcriptional regulator